MSRIRGKNTSPELMLRAALRHAGFTSYRVDVKTPGGRADIALMKTKIAIFVDGCFWHGCPEHYVMPRGNSAFWKRKLEENVLRDARQTATLLELGWIVVRVWEDQIRVDAEGVAEKIVAAASHRKSLIATRRRVVAVEPEQDGIERRQLLDLLHPERRSVQRRRRTTHKVGVKKNALVR